MNNNKNNKHNKIIGIQDVDTRMLTRIIRDEGAMNAVISSTNLSKQSLKEYMTKFVIVKVDLQI